jgi:uncharacterized protein (DUF924 family)
VAAITSSREILRFWFEELEQSRWWVKDPEFDRSIGKRFGAVHAQAIRSELFGWRVEPEGRLAEIIVLDQFSRNIFRDRPEAFAADACALTLAQEAVGAKADRALGAEQRTFLYLPFMHSESLVIHDSAAELFAATGNAQLIEFERKHRRIIERFGRYPHRNAILGRESSVEELAFLQQPDSSF